MLKIRLSRHGKKRQPSYRVVVSEARFKRDGRYVERLGWFNPLTDPETYLINEGRALYWLSKGAQPTEAVKRLLKKQGTLDRLVRFHEGESMEVLVAEYEGVDLTAQAAAKAEEVQEAVAETVEEAQEAAEEVVAEAEEVVEEVEETVAEEAEEAQGVVASAVETVQETASDVAETVQEMAGDALETAQDAVSNVVETVSEAVSDSDESEEADAEEEKAA